MKPGELIEHVNGNTECILLWVKHVDLDPIRVIFCKAETSEVTGSLSVTVKNYYNHFSESTIGRNIKPFEAKPEELFTTEHAANCYRVEGIQRTIDKLTKLKEELLNETK